MNGAQSRRDRVHGRPVLVRQQTQTDLARGDGNIRVADRSAECYGRRFVRVVVGNGDGEEPETVRIRRSRGEVLRERS